MFTLIYTDKSGKPCRRSCEALFGNSVTNQLQLMDAGATVGIIDLATIDGGINVASDPRAAEEAAMTPLERLNAAAKKVFGGITTMPGLNVLIVLCLCAATLCAGTARAAEADAAPVMMTPQRSDKATHEALLFGVITMLIVGGVAIGCIIHIRRENARWAWAALPPVDTSLWGVKVDAAHTTIAAESLMEAYELCNRMADINAAYAAHDAARPFTQPSVTRWPGTPAEHAAELMRRRRLMAELMADRTHGGEPCEGTELLA